MAYKALQKYIVTYYDDYEKKKRCKIVWAEDVDAAIIKALGYYPTPQAHSRSGSVHVEKVH